MITIAGSPRLRTIAVREEKAMVALKLLTFTVSSHLLLEDDV